jgi:hypothetical protein
LSTEYLVDPSIFWRCSDEFEELLALIARPSTDISVHIPEKWNRSLDHMNPTHLSADDSEFTRIQECIELMSWKEIETDDILIP